jgi:microcystin-dependent protein
MDPFLGEIRLLPFNFAPRGWALCQGQILSIQQNTALFALLGVQYGGNGSTTFALPDLRGRSGVHKGQGAGLSNYVMGQVSGVDSVTLLPTQIPAHAHTISDTLPVSTGASAGTNAQGSYFGTSVGEQYGETPNHANTAALLTGTSGATGGNQPHENRMPFLALNYCIATQGIFPQRN